MRGPIRHRRDLGHIAGENTGEVTAEDLDPEAARRSVATLGRSM